MHVSWIDKEARKDNKSYVYAEPNSPSKEFDNDFLHLCVVSRTTNHSADLISLLWRRTSIVIGWFFPAKRSVRVCVWREREREKRRKREKEKERERGRGREREREGGREGGRVQEDACVWMCDDVKLCLRGTCIHMHVHASLIIM